MVMINRCTLFVVDSDPVVCRALGKLTPSLPYRVAFFDQAESFLDQYETDQPGAVLADMQLPGIDGLQLIDALHRQSAVIPVIMHSLHNGTQMIVRAMQAGAYDFLKKPAKSSCLLQYVEKAMAEDAQRRQINTPATPARLRTSTHNFLAAQAYDDGPDSSAPMTATATIEPPERPAFSAWHRKNTPSSATHDSPALSPRLKQTLVLLMRGNSEKQIAHNLNLSPHTIHDYIKALHKHFDVSSRGELLAKCWDLSV